MVLQALTLPSGVLGERAQPDPATPLRCWTPPEFQEQRSAAAAATSSLSPVYGPHQRSTLVEHIVQRSNVGVVGPGGFPAIPDQALLSRRCCRRRLRLNLSSTLRRQGPPEWMAAGDCIKRVSETSFQPSTQSLILPNLNTRGHEVLLKLLLLLPAATAPLFPQPGPAAAPLLMGHCERTLHQSGTDSQNEA